MQFASDQNAGGMMGVSGLTECMATQLCEEAPKQSNEHITIGNYLSPSKFALSGGKLALEAAAVLLSSPPYAGKTVSTTPLAVAGAFHTKLMEPAKVDLEKALELTPFHETQIPVISNVDGKPHSSPAEIRRKLGEQLITPVQWGLTMANMLGDPSFERAYEIGPGRVCSGIIKSINRRAKVVSVSV